jgi:hypothetical protein
LIFLPTVVLIYVRNRPDEPLPCPTHALGGSIIYAYQTLRLHISLMRSLPWETLYPLHNTWQGRLMSAAEGWGTLGTLDVLEDDSPK